MTVVKASQPKRRTSRGKAAAALKSHPGKPSAVRIVDHALRDAGWSVSARREIIRLLKAGVGDAPFVHSTADDARLTENGGCPTSDVTHATRCECQGINPDAVWTSGMSSAADPIDK